MSKKLLNMLLALCMVLALLPVTARAASVITVGTGGNYALSETGLKDAISAASNGDTIKFISSGTITQTGYININKSVTLDLNGQTINFIGTFYCVNIQASVTIQGPGTITMDRFMQISSGSTLTVKGGAVIEGTGVWQPLINSGTFSMTGGTLKQTGTGYVLLNSGAGVATFDNATIEAKPSNVALIWNADSSTLTLNNCTTRNIYSGTGSWATKGSIIFITHTSTVTLNGGTVTGPTGSSAPAVLVASGTTFANNGATITNGYVKKLGDLTVSVSSGINKVTLASQTPEAGVTYYYKTTATDDTANKPASDGSADFVSAGWTAFSTGTDIPASVTAAVYVQVVKVGDSELKICGWGQGSATPMVMLPISNFTKTSQTTTTAAFSWTAAAGATEVKVQQSLHNANTWSDAITGAIANNATTATVTGLTAGTAYDFKLVVTGGSNAGDSNTVAVTTDTIPSATPVASITTVSKTAATQASVSFALTNNPAYADNQMWTVYSAVYGADTANGITASNTGNTLTLTHATDVPAGTYYAAVTENGKSESGRLALTVEAYTPPAAINISAILGVTPPVAGAAPVTTITECDQYTGTVAWSGAPTTFGYSTAYTATITLTAKTGYTLTGVAANFFTVAGATSVSNSVYSGVVTAVFPATAHAPSGGGGSSYTPTAPVTKIDNGGSVTGSNLNQLISGGKTLTVEDDNGAKLVFNSDALKGIYSQTAGNIKVEMKEVTQEHQDSHPGKLVFSLTIASDTKTISDFGGSATVSLPYKLKEGEHAEDVTVWYLSGDGTMTEIPCTYDQATGLATFRVSHFSLYMVGTNLQETSFSDVGANDWFYDAVQYVYKNNLMQGTGSSHFSPNAVTTRGMVVTTLWRMESKPAAAAAASFTDVAEGMWYTDAIKWASVNGIVTGYDGMFAPDSAVTREQLAAMLYRYAKYKGYDVNVQGNLSMFKDSPSDWALESMRWAVSKGLLQGVDKDTLDPSGKAIRAQFAAILHRYYKNVAK